MMFLQQFPWCERYIILQEPAEGAENGTAANGMEETLRYLGHHDTACLSTSVCYLAVSKAVTMSRVHSAADIIGVKNKCPLRSTSSVLEPLSWCRAWCKWQHV